MAQHSNSVAERGDSVSVERTGWMPATLRSLAAVIGHSNHHPALCHPHTQQTRIPVAAWLSPAAAMTNRIVGKKRGTAMVVGLLNARNQRETTKLSHNRTSRTVPLDDGSQRLAFRCRIAHSDRTSAFQLSSTRPLPATAISLPSPLLASQLVSFPTPLSHSSFHFTRHVRG